MPWSSWTRADAAVLLAVLGISAMLVWPELFRGWAAMDDGAMAQVAERVLRGQLPHRDFDDPWTGGWSYLQAGIFRLFGMSLRMLRIPIFVVWMGSLACGLRLARRFATPSVAGIATLAWAVWSLYAWHYPLLNWYYAPLALFSVWGVTRFVETGHRRYLVFAGVIAGVALILKITGLFLLAALLLWSAAHVAYVASRVSGVTRAWGYAVFVTGAGAIFVLLAALLVLGLPSDVHGSAFYLYVLPLAAMVLWLGRSARTAGLAFREGVKALVALLLPLAVGVAVPLLIFLLFYVVHGAVRDLMIGVFVRPAVRLALIWSPPPGRVATAGMMLAPIVLALGVRYAAPGRARASALYAIVLGTLAGVLAQRDQFTASSAALMVRSLPMVLPCVALWGNWRREEEPGPYGSVVFLLIACATTANLLQVPFANLQYALYAVPIAVLAFVALVTSRSVTPAPPVLLLGTFLIAAGIGHPATTSLAPEPRRWALLALPRGGILVSPQDSERFQQVAQLMAKRPAGPIHVVGDAPEYSFLLERPTVSRVIYDVLADSSAKDERLVLPMLKRAGVRSVLLQESYLDDSLTARQRRALRREFPESRAFGRLTFDGRTFRRYVEVRWRDDSAR